MARIRAECIIILLSYDSITFYHVSEIKCKVQRYWKTVIDCRWLLDSEIAERRRVRNYNQYVIHFDYLTDKACVYAKQNRFLDGKWANRCKYSMIEGRIQYLDHTSEART